eukprot:352791-Chlamydomonas_euryale.AAC.2
MRGAMCFRLDYWEEGPQHAVSSRMLWPATTSGFCQALGRRARMYALMPRLPGVAGLSSFSGRVCDKGFYIAGREFGPAYKCVCQSQSFRDVLEQGGHRLMRCFIRRRRAASGGLCIGDAACTCTELSATRTAHQAFKVDAPCTSCVLEQLPARMWRAACSEPSAHMRRAAGMARIQRQGRTTHVHACKQTPFLHIACSDQAPAPSIFVLKHCVLTVLLSHVRTEGAQKLHAVGLPAVTLHCRPHKRTFAGVCASVSLAGLPPLFEWIRWGQPVHTPPQRPPDAESIGRHKGR